MTTIPKDDVAAFISGLPTIDPQMTQAMRARANLPSAPAPSDPPSNVPSASVVGNSLVSFTENLDSTHKTDLLYAMGFAQLQAVQAGFDPKAAPMGYYNYVTNLLQQVGFVAQDIQFAKYQTTTQTVKLDKVVLEILGGILAAPELALVDAAVEALKATQDDDGGPWTIYSSHSVSNKAGGFSIGVANQSNGPDGKTPNVSLDLGAFTFSGSTNSTDFLWMSYSSTSLSIENGKTGVVLNDDLWNAPGVGDAIADAMKSHSAGYIAHLPKLKA